MSAESNKALVRRFDEEIDKGNPPGGHSRFASHRIAGGKLGEKWSEKELMAFLQQSGVPPSMRR